MRDEVSSHNRDTFMEEKEMLNAAITESKI